MHSCNLQDSAWEGAGGAASQPSRFTATPGRGATSQRRTELLLTVISRSGGGLSFHQTRNIIHDGRICARQGDEATPVLPTVRAGRTRRRRSRGKAVQVEHIFSLYDPVLKESARVSNP